MRRRLPGYLYLPTNHHRWLPLPIRFSSIPLRTVPIMGGLQAIKYTRGKLLVLDQLRLPYEHHFDEISTSEQAFDCIKLMRVRGQFDPSDSEDLI